MTASGDCREQDFLDFAKSKEWKEKVSAILDDRRKRWKAEKKFFGDDIRTTPEERAISWRAFPKRLQESGDGKWAQADKREAQDEYCEWNVERNADKKIVKVTFTAEMHEFFDEFKAVSKKSPDNSLNDRHMTLSVNSLLAAVDLVARIASLPGGKGNQSGESLLESVKLIKSQGRASDTMIAKEVYSLCEDGFQLGFKNPVGMYLDDFNDEDFIMPKVKGKNIKVNDWYRFERSVDGGPMRLIFEVPKEHNFVIGDIKNRKRNALIKHGSELARFISVKLILLYVKNGNNRQDPEPSIPGGDEGSIWGYVMGRDAERHILDKRFVSKNLTDYMGKHLQQHGSTKYLTTRSFIESLPNGTWMPFVAYDALGVSDKVDHGVGPRVLFVCTPEAEKAKEKGGSVGDPAIITRAAFDTPTILITCSANFDSETEFLQLASFDPGLGWYNFYHRRARKDVLRWEYHGCSKDAFQPDTRCIGPFCGHVNGSLVMKELREPWVHWISSVQRTLKGTLRSNHVLWKQKLLGESLRNIQEADRLEHIIVKGVNKWFKTRCEQDFKEDIVSGADQWMSHVLLTTTVNIAASRTSSVLVRRGKGFQIPEGFFYNKEAFDALFGDELQVKSIVEVNSKHYLLKISDLAISIVYESNGDEKVAEPNEGQSPWTVLVPSLEDIVGLETIRDQELLPLNELTALIMVDFCNPIFSWRRAALVQYVPSTARKQGTQSQWNLAEAITTAIKATASNQDRTPQDPTPEQEYRTNLDEINKKFNGKAIAFVQDRLNRYVDRVNHRLGDPDGRGIKDYLLLAESHRRTFRPPKESARPRNPLSEKVMALPFTRSLPRDSKPRRMKMDGSTEVCVVPRTQEKVWHQRFVMPPYIISGCPAADTT